MCLMRGHPATSCAQGVGQTWRGERERQRERERNTFLHNHISLHSDWKIIMIGLTADILASLFCPAFAIMSFTSESCLRRKIRKYGVLKCVPATSKQWPCKRRPDRMFWSLTEYCDGCHCYDRVNHCRWASSFIWFICFATAKVIFQKYILNVMPLQNLSPLQCIAHSVNKSW